MLVLAVLVAIVIKSNALSWDSVFTSLAKIGIVNFLLALSMAVAQYSILAARFVLLLPKASANVARRQICRIFTNGQLFNHLFPARAGDLYKVIALKGASTDPTFSSAYVVSALIIERLVSTLVLLSLIALLVDWSGVAIADLSFLDRSRQIKTLAAVILLLAVAFYVAQKRSKKLHQWLIELKRSFIKILGPQRLFIVVVLSIMIWSLEVVSMKFVAAPLGIDLQLGQGLFVLLLLNLGIAVPVTLGNIGTYEAVLVIGLSLWGVSTSDAIVVALSHHALQILSLAILAGVLNTLVYFFKEQARQTPR